MVKKKILIIEDEQTLLKVLMGVLGDKYELGVATDGDAGWAKIKIFKPDLILLDLILPKIDGFSLLTKFKKSRFGKNIPVFVLTNLSDAAEKVLSLGAERCFIKSDKSMDSIRDEIDKRLS